MIRFLIAFIIASCLMYPSRKETPVAEGPLDSELVAGSVLD